jgi:hypothetical protein
MSTSRPDGADDRKTPGRIGSVHSGRADTDVQLSMGGGDSRPDYGSGNPGGGRRKRRRQRPQQSKPPRPHEQRRSGGGARLDVVSRERVFQSVEGLLRQIREQAEETSQWTEDELREITQTVTTFTKSLEQEADPISERARMEYQRIREKLSQALTRAEQAARESAGGF